MKVFSKVVFLPIMAVASVILLGGCSSSNESKISPQFEEAVRAPKGPMPAEAQAEMEKMKSQQSADKPANLPAK